MTVVQSRCIAVPNIPERALGFIFARGGSKGVPRKNIKPLNGKPLIAYSIETAHRCSCLQSVIVSTEDQEIADVARRYGAEVPFMRPVELASDAAPEWLAWQHAVRWAMAERGSFDVFVSTPATSPFRDPADIEACVATLRSDPAADIVVTIKEAERSPYCNMVKIDGIGYARTVIASSSDISRRQDAPRVYDITTVGYAARPSYILQAKGLFDGKVRTVLVPAERSLDIDTPYDFHLAELLASQKATQ